MLHVGQLRIGIDYTMTNLGEMQCGETIPTVVGEAVHLGMMRLI